MLSAKVKNKNCQNIKRLSLSFLFFEGQNAYIDPFIFILCYTFAETLFKKKLNILIINYKNILNFNIFLSLAGV